MYKLFIWCILDREGIIINFKIIYKKFFLKSIVIFILMVLLISVNVFASEDSIKLKSNINIDRSKNYDYKKNITLSYPEIFIPKFNVRGIYVTGWVAGLSERMNKLIDFVDNTILNTMVIDVKDDLGYLSYSSDVETAKRIKSSKLKIRDIRSLLSLLDKHNIHTIARIVVFKDSLLAQKRPDLALHIKEENEINSGDRTGNPTLPKIDKTDKTYKNTFFEAEDQDKYSIYESENWVDPACKEVWSYNIKVAREALQLGFDEVQFDYIRYPALRGIKSVKTEENKEDVINQFVVVAQKKLSDFNKPISVDVFGLTTSVSGGLGIGQNFNKLAETAKIISPMIYPSHYSHGVYGLSVPEKNPYETVHNSMKDALGKTKSKIILRPWLQDFSINHKYFAQDVIDQINAVESLGINEWLLWNPSSRYTRNALDHFQLKRDFYRKRYELKPSF